MHPSAKFAGAVGALMGRLTCLEVSVILSDVQRPSDVEYVEVKDGMTVSRFGAVGEWRGSQRFHIGFSLSLIHESDRIKIVQMLQVVS